MLGNILKDKSVAGQEAERELLRLQETMDGPSFVCVNLYPEIETDKKEEIPLMLFAIDNILRELTEKHMLVQSLKYDNYLSCIFNGDFTGGSPGGTEAENSNGILKEYSAKTEILELSLARLQEKMKEYFDPKEAFYAKMRVYIDLLTHMHWPTEQIGGACSRGYASSAIRTVSKYRDGLRPPK